MTLSNGTVVINRKVELHEKLDIDPRNKAIQIYMDDAQSKPTTSATSPEGRMNTFLVEIYPTRLGIGSSMRRQFGLLSYDHVCVTSY